jgi:hypothetical protein
MSTALLLLSLCVNRRAFVASNDAINSLRGTSLPLVLPPNLPNRLGTKRAKSILIHLMCWASSSAAHRRKRTVTARRQPTVTGRSLVLCRSLCPSRNELRLSSSPTCFGGASCHTHTLARGSPTPPRYDGRRRGRDVSVENSSNGLSFDASG